MNHKTIEMPNFDGLPDFANIAGVQIAEGLVVISFFFFLPHPGGNDNEPRVKCVSQIAYPLDRIPAVIRLLSNAISQEEQRINELDRNQSETSSNGV